jgi:hypothetical protein
MRLPFRGVASHTWRRRTFQIARLLISSGSPNWARTLGKIPSKRKPFCCSGCEPGRDALRVSRRPNYIAAADRGASRGDVQPTGEAASVAEPAQHPLDTGPRSQPSRSFHARESRRSSLGSHRHRCAARTCHAPIAASTARAMRAAQRLAPARLAARAESAFRAVAEQPAADSRAVRRPERERNGLAPARRLR